MKLCAEEIVALHTAAVQLEELMIIKGRRGKVLLPGASASRTAPFQARSGKGERTPPRKGPKAPANVLSPANPSIASPGRGSKRKDRVAENQERPESDTAVAGA